MENCIDILKWALWRVSVRKGINYKQKWPINNLIILKTFATVLNTWCRKTYEHLFFNFCIFNALFHIFNKYLYISICGPHTDMCKNTSKTQEKPNPTWHFQSFK
jgi:hypothetical protein